MYRDSASQITTRWEYRTLSAGDIVLDKKNEGMVVAALNELGAEGWEAVGLTITPHMSNTLVLLKRLVQ